MAHYPGSIPVSGYVAPYDDQDTYFTHTEELGRGGFRSVASQTERYAITNDRRKLGMFVHQLNNDTYWQLRFGLTNSNWVQVTFGNGNDTEYQVDVIDNITNNYIIGDITLHRSLFLNYVLQSNDNLKYEAGRIMIIHDGYQCNIDIGRFGLISGAIGINTSIEYGVDLSLNAIRLNISSNLNGSNLKFRYTIKSMSLME